MKQTIKISLSDLRQFKKSSSFIKNRGVIPIQDYIKFDNGEIIKNNLKEFIIFKTSFTGSFLVDERVLFNFIDYSNASDILFTVDKKKIIISDGSTEVVSQGEDIDNFHSAELPTAEKIQINSETLLAIQIAAKYTHDEEFHQIKPYVFIGKSSVAASDGLIGFIKNFDFDLPEIVISHRTADKIGSLSNVYFSQNDNAHFFEFGNTILGFAKPEAKFVDLTRYFSFEKNTAFTINKEDLLTFNDTCVSISPSKNIYPVFEMNGTGLKLSMVDGDYNINVKKTIPASGNMEGKFQYIATLMSKLLKTAPDQDLIFYQSLKKFYITGESGFTSLIMEIIP